MEKVTNMNPSKLILATLAAMLLVTLSPETLAADGAELYQTRTCFTCHGKDGKSPLLPEYPKVAGQNAAYSLQQMKDIKSGARDNSISAAMKGIMHLVSDEDMQLLAEYIETLEP